MKGLIKQLQLGNYIGIGKPEDNIVVQVDAIHNGKIGYHKTPDRLTYIKANQLYPIEISKSFLDGVYECFGKNETVGVIFYHVATDIDIEFYESSNYACVLGNNLKCKYLHQLQNLINFAFDNIKETTNQN